MIGDIQKLRDMTGAGVMECKRALGDARGDLTQAVALIHERGAARAEKRQARGTGAGLIETYVHNERIGVILELRAETDFVVRSAPFRMLARDLAMHVAAMAPETRDELLTQLYVKDAQLTVADLVKRVAAQVGEHIQVERFTRYEI